MTFAKQLVEQWQDIPSHQYRRRIRRQHLQYIPRSHNQASRPTALPARRRIRDTLEQRPMQAQDQIITNMPKIFHMASHNNQVTMPRIHTGQPSVLQPRQNSSMATTRRRLVVLVSLAIMTTTHMTWTVVSPHHTRENLPCRWCSTRYLKRGDLPPGNTVISVAVVEGKHSVAKKQPDSQDYHLQIPTSGFWMPGNICYCKPWQNSSCLEALTSDNKNNDFTLDTIANPRPGS